MTETRACEYCKHMATVRLEDRTPIASLCAVDVKRNYELDGRAGNVRTLPSLQSCCHLFERSDLWTMS